MKLSLRTFIPAPAVGMTALLSACMNTEDRVKSYMIRANHSQMEYEKILSNENERFIQSKLDSLAYRDVFNGTQAAKDSACVAEFNKIAADMRPASDFSESKAIEIIKKKLTEKGISVKDFQSVTNQSSEVRWSFSLRTVFSKNSGGNIVPLCGDDNTTGNLISLVLNSSKMFRFL